MTDIRGLGYIRVQTTDIPRWRELTVEALGLGVMTGALTLHEGGNEPIFTMVGVGVLALGHRLNFMAAE